MKTVGIIAEFNPFHKGHEYLVNEAKRKTCADHVVVAMSGNYTQRGLPAMMDMHLRTQMALISGISAVYEIPVALATSSAQDFAYGGVALLNGLGCVDYLAFGADGRLDGVSKEEFAASLERVSDLLTEEPEEFKESLRLYIKNGDSYPLALKKAAADSVTLSKQEEAVLESSNSILALEYMRALKITGSKIKPVVIERFGSNYNTMEYEKGKYASAGAIRDAIIKSRRSSRYRLYKKDMDNLPAGLLDIYMNRLNVTYPVEPADFAPLIAESTYRMFVDGLGTVNDDDMPADLDIGLKRRIINNIGENPGMESFTKVLKKKNITYTHVSRALLHMTLGISQIDVSYYKDRTFLPYARLLGSSSDAAGLLRNIKHENPGMLTIDKPAAVLNLNKNADEVFQKIKKMYSKDFYCDGLYGRIQAVKFGIKPYNEFGESVRIKIK